MFILTQVFLNVSSLNKVKILKHDSQNNFKVENVIKMKNIIFLFNP